MYTFIAFKVTPDILSEKERQIFEESSLDPSHEDLFLTVMAGRKLRRQAEEKGVKIELSTNPEAWLFLEGNAKTAESIINDTSDDKTEVMFPDLEKVKVTVQRCEESVSS